MLFDFVRQKISRMEESTDGSLLQALQAMLAVKPADVAIWQHVGQKILSQMMVRMATEEEVPAFVGGGEALRDRLPDRVGNAISQLSEVLVLPVPEEPEDARLIAVHLLLNISEWMVNNYENRCLYGEKENRNASDLLKALHLGVEIWGDKDEVWLVLGELLDEWSLGKAFRAASPVLGSRTYGVRLERIRSPRLMHPAIWAGGVLPEVATLIITVTGTATDHTYVQALLTGRAETGQDVPSSGRFEGEFFAALAENCGSPE